MKWESTGGWRNWHCWFAWYPVEINRGPGIGKTVWLEWVEREGIWCLDGKEWNYRLRGENK